MNFNIITIFPSLISHYCHESILGRAQAEKLITVNAVDLRDFTTDKHRTVDDTPYGGGAGMVMKPEPIYRALDSLGARFSVSVGLPLAKGEREGVKMSILLSPRGRQFDQRLAEAWAKLDEITFVCGRYEGVDQRVADYLVDEEISIGPYVLAGGELAALVIIEAVSRLVPGVLGNDESLAEESFSMPFDSNSANSSFINRYSSLEYPQYTKPADFMGWQVPAVLLSGDHQKIETWRKQGYPHQTTGVLDKDFT